ncbi:MAG: GGDEF domain-containing protein [Lachnospiraceae bacterium]|nr:GGDEF domain-containing protein [Lachnospiraceae bacterium]
MNSNRRKRIGLFVSFPEIVHVRRVTDGIRRRCAEYGYDLCVFASSVHVSSPMEDFVAGETNIYELANLAELDGAILDFATLNDGADNRSLNRLLERIRAYPDLPVCSLEAAMEGTTFIENNNEEPLRELCRHVIEVHGKKKLCLLTGHKGNTVAEKRLSIFLDEIEKHGISVPPEHIFYGDFWYTSGDRLAEDIADGRVERPEAVLCASDCMALGLIDKLVKRGIKVPEDIIVIGFDGSDEGTINFIPLSSYDPNDVDMGMRAVDHIRSVIEPDAPILPKTVKAGGHFHPGASCGCQSDPYYILKQVRTLLHSSTYNYADENSDLRVSVGALMESYYLERFTASRTVEECLRNIFGSANILIPYSALYLCLSENWLDMQDERTEGYPEHMLLYSKPSTLEEEYICGAEGRSTFDTARMLPRLDEERDRPSVFFFSPLHFNGKILGYSVLEKEITESHTLNVVNRNWLRFINNALEMSRTKHRLETLSVRDEMTGAYNRRGMYLRFKEMYEEAAPGDALYVSVVDMDGLKYINDTYGHNEGDLGIRTVCSALQETARKNEIVVRSGGDEFFLIGIGKYEKGDEVKRSQEYTGIIEKRSAELGKPYNISASIGCVVYEDLHAISLDNALSEADERMYHYKFRQRRHRRI